MKMEAKEDVTVEAKQFKVNLEDYEDVFVEPTSLSRNREHDHHIIH